MVEGIGSDHLAWTFLSGAHRLLVRFAWIRRVLPEPFRFFIDQGALPSFLGERGLDLVEHLDASEMESAYSTGDAGAPTGKVTGFFRLAVACPEPTS